jgi:hypothetical protein
MHYYTEQELELLAFRANGYGKLSLGELEILLKELTGNNEISPSSRISGNNDGEGEVSNQDIPF